MLIMFCQVYCHNFPRAPGGLAVRVLHFAATTWVWFQVNQRETFLHTSVVVAVQSLSHVQLSVIPRTAACQASLAFTRLSEIAQIHVHWTDDAIQSSCSPSSPSPSAFNLLQHQDLFPWVGSLHQVAKVLELQHQSFQWIFKVDFLYIWLLWSPCSPRDS